MGDAVNARNEGSGDNAKSKQDTNKNKHTVKAQVYNFTVGVILTAW